MITASHLLKALGAAASQPYMPLQASSAPLLCFVRQTAEYFSLGVPQLDAWRCRVTCPTPMPTRWRIVLYTLANSLVSAKIMWLWKQRFLRFCCATLLSK